MGAYKQGAGNICTRHYNALDTVNDCLTTRGCEDNTRFGMARVLRCRFGIVQEDNCEVGTFNFWKGSKRQLTPPPVPQNGPSLHMHPHPL